MVQEKEERDSTWYGGIKEMIIYYNIKKDVTKVMKSEWKKEVKEKINMRVEEYVRSCCQKGRKTRTVKGDVFGMKMYLLETSVTEASDIMKTRLHMTKLACNYGGEQKSSCPLCGCQTVIETEHYFKKCKVTKHLARIWGAEEEDVKLLFICHHKITNTFSNIYFHSEPHITEHI